MVIQDVNRIILELFDEKIAALRESDFTDKEIVKLQAAKDYYLAYSVSLSLGKAKEYALDKIRDACGEESV